MNQILHQKVRKPKKVNIQPRRKNFSIEFSDEITEIPYIENINSTIHNLNTNSNLNPKTNSMPSYSKTQKYHWQFIVSILIAIIFLFFLSWKLYQNNSQEKIAKELLNSYQLTTLYSDTQTYETTKTNSGQKTSAPFVIGMIKIDKIDLNYPILSESNDELLKISLCRFSGPLPNESGNLCIAGHNYLNNRFFSRLDELKIGDLIEVYGLSGEKQEYKISKKYEVDDNDLSCTSQEIGNTKMITLLTCDNTNQNKRIVVQGEVL